MTRSYIHGFTPGERERLSRMQLLLNVGELELLRLDGERTILDVGAGLAQMARCMARGSDRRVLAIERDPTQLEQARKLAALDGEQDLVELRQGDAARLPLSDEERGGFDLAHARFLLEHVPDPQAVVDEMVRAVRVGGRVCLLDDDHELLRLHPRLPEFERAWEVYWRSYEDLGCDPCIGRRLPELLTNAGARPTRMTTLFYGACHGMEPFPGVVRNLIEVLAGAADALDRDGRLPRADMDPALERFRAWSERPGAALWYSLPFAEGTRAS